MRMRRRPVRQDKMSGAAYPPLQLTRFGAGGDENLDVARTAALTTLVLFQKVHVFNCRSESVSIFKKSLLKNKLLLVGVLTSLAIHIAALYIPVTQELLRFTPLDALTWAAAVGIAATAIIVNEAHKRFRP